MRTSKTMGRRIGHLWIAIGLLLSLVTPAARGDFVFGERADLTKIIPAVDPYYDSLDCASYDGLELYIGSESRPDGFGAADICVVRRASISDVWGPLQNLGPIVNSAKPDLGTCISADGLTLYFGSTRDPNDPNNLDIYMTTRATKNDPWGQPVRLPPPVNSSATEGSPWISPDGLELLFTSNDRPDGHGQSDLWVARRATVNAPWGEPANVGPVVNSEFHDWACSLSPDGLLLLFAETFMAPFRAGGQGGGDIWMARRASLSAPWQAPVNLGAKVNSPICEFYPRISPDGRTLYFSTVDMETWTWGSWQAPIIPVVDFNADGKADVVDVAFLMNHWGKNQPACDIGPMPWGDGVVDAKDLAVLLEFLAVPGPRAADVPPEVILSWTAPAFAQTHDVYFGTSFEAVNNATRLDPLGVLVSLGQTATTYDPVGLLELGRTYYWRIDGIGAAPDYTVFKGNVCRFSTTESFVVDDFEGYTDIEGAGVIWETWVDGWANGSTSEVGYWLPPRSEVIIVHSGKQAMPMGYNNLKPPHYGEVERTFGAPQDWTVNGATELFTWFRGMPASFDESPQGHITMSAIGTDIWNTADQFRFACKQLKANGSIIAKAESLVKSNDWAKAGVMIRQSLDADSKFVYMIQSCARGVSFGWRPQAAGACGSLNQAGVAAPQWVKLTRAGDVFTAQYSADGKTWTDIQGADGTVASTTVAMTDPVYVGLAVTSHDGKVLTEAEFSNISITGGVTGDWQVAEIGRPMPGNAPAPLYVALEDSFGARATVIHPDEKALLTTTWTEWRVPFSKFTGLDPGRVTKMRIGVGDGNKPNIVGDGMLRVDDIGVGHSLSSK